VGCVCFVVHVVSRICFGLFFVGLLKGSDVPFFVVSRPGVACCFFSRVFVVRFLPALCFFFVVFLMGDSGVFFFFRCFVFTFFFCLLSSCVCVDVTSVRLSHLLCVPGSALFLCLVLFDELLRFLFADVLC